MQIRSGSSTGRGSSIGPVLHRIHTFHRHSTPRPEAAIVAGAGVAARSASQKTGRRSRRTREQGCRILQRMDEFGVIRETTDDVALRPVDHQVELMLADTHTPTKHHAPQHRGRPSLHRMPPALARSGRALAAQGDGRLAARNSALLRALCEPRVRACSVPKARVTPPGSAAGPPLGAGVSTARPDQRDTKHRDPAVPPTQRT